MKAQMKMKKIVKSLSDAEIAERSNELGHLIKANEKRKADLKRDTEKARDSIKANDKRIKELAEIIVNREEEVEEDLQPKLFGGDVSTLV